MKNNDASDENGSLFGKLLGLLNSVLKPVAQLIAKIVNAGVPLQGNKVSLKSIIERGLSEFMAPRGGEEHKKILIVAFPFDKETKTLRYKGFTDPSTRKSMWDFKLSDLYERWIADEHSKYFYGKWSLHIRNAGLAKILGSDVFPVDYTELSDFRASVLLGACLFECLPAVSEMKDERLTMEALPFGELVALGDKITIVYVVAHLDPDNPRGGGPAMAYWLEIDFVNNVVQVSRKLRIHFGPRMREPEAKDKSDNISQSKSDSKEKPIKKVDPKKLTKKRERVYTR